MMTGCVDSHFHLWRYSPAEYGWISEDMQPLRRDFLPAELQQEMRGADVQRAVVVQARQTLEETAWLLGLAREFPFVAGVVDWAPLTNPDFLGQLEFLAADPRLKGLRHVLQDEPDDTYMLRDDFQRGMATLQGTGLVYDIQGLRPAKWRLFDVDFRHSEPAGEFAAQPGSDTLIPW